MCRNQKDVRTLRIEKASGEKCAAFYSKNGTEQNIGSSRKHEDCLSYTKKVQDILERNKWICKEVPVSTLSSVGD